jgi:hypothetical protein
MLSLRKLRTRSQETAGWPESRSFRDKGEWNLDENNVPKFYKLTAGRITFTTWPRQAWRNKPKP